MKYKRSELVRMARMFLSEYYLGDKHGKCRHVIQELQFKFGYSSAQVFKMISRMGSARG